MRSVQPLHEFLRFLCPFRAQKRIIVTKIRVQIFAIYLSNCQRPYEHNIPLETLGKSFWKEDK